MIDLIVVGVATSITGFGLLCLFAHGIDSLAKRVRTLEMENALTARGYFLRDDRPIREGVDHFTGAEEAYSLIQRSPYERLHVFAGPKPWAVEQAYAAIFRKGT